MNKPREIKKTHFKSIVQPVISTFSVPSLVISNLDDD